MDKQIATRVGEEIHARLAADARAEGRSVAAEVRLMIERRYQAGSGYGLNQIAQQTTTMIHDPKVGGTVPGSKRQARPMPKEQSAR